MCLQALEYLVYFLLLCNVMSSDTRTPAPTAAVLLSVCVQYCWQESRPSLVSVCPYIQSQGVPRPDGICSPSGKFWVYLCLLQWKELRRHSTFSDSFRCRRSSGSTQRPFRMPSPLTPFLRLSPATENRDGSFWPLVFAISFVSCVHVYGGSQCHCPYPRRAS